MRILNIYGQESEHLDAKIVGNKAGLIELQNAIYDAMKQGKATTTMYASDGEGYELTIEEHNDEWGCYAPKYSYWNKPESNPMYYQTASLVAQEIFKELEEIMPMFYINHIQDYYAIKSRWVKE